MRCARIDEALVMRVDDWLSERLDQFNRTVAESGTRAPADDTDPPLRPNHAGSTCSGSHRTAVRDESGRHL